MQIYHVTQENGRWSLKEDGVSAALLEADDRQEILDEAREYMKTRIAKVLVHDSDGQVVEEHRYPQEQHPL